MPPLGFALLKGKQKRISKNIKFRKITNLIKIKNLIRAKD
jgi:hypothetical protein